MLQIQLLLNLKDVSIIDFNSHSFTIVLPCKFHICPHCGNMNNVFRRIIKECFSNAK